MGGLYRGDLILYDLLVQGYRTGKLGLKKARDTSTGAWVYGLSLGVLGWTEEKRGQCLTHGRSPSGQSLRPVHQMVRSKAGLGLAP